MALTGRGNKLINKALLIWMIFSLISISFPSIIFAKEQTGCNLSVLFDNGQVEGYVCSSWETQTQATNYWLSKKGVSKVSPAQSYKITAEPTDPGFEYQRSYLDLIKAPVGWEKTVNIKLRPVIAVLDSGVDINNPDLQSNIWFNPWEVPGDRQDNDRNGFVDDQYGWDFVMNTPDPMPKYEEGWTEVAMQHGTVVAGVAAAIGNNYVGVTGVNWQARIMPLRVLNGKGSGDTVTVAKAINYAVANGADIINLSFVGEHSDPILKQVIANAFNAGVMVVAASGNEQSVGVDLDLHPQYPVCDDGTNGDNQVIGVAAIDVNSVVADFSNYGSKCIDISAPGVKIFSTQYQDKTNVKFQDSFGGYWSGTSVAAPMVSGALALLKSVYPQFRPSQLRDVLIASGDQIDTVNTTKAGKIGRRLNLASAFQLIETLKVVTKSPIVIAPASQFKPQIDVLDSQGAHINSFLAYHPRFLGGVNVAVGDLDGDGILEVVTAPKANGGPHIRIFNQKGDLKGQFMAFVETFRGGLSLAVHDVNNDGKDDIILGIGNGAVPLIRIFDGQGNMLNQFQAYDITYTGGVNVTAGDLNNDGQVEIITTAKKGNLPLRIFDRFGSIKQEIKVYPSAFRGGVNITTGDVNGDGSDEIIAVPGEGGGPQVRIFTMTGKVISQFFAFNSNWRSGVTIASGDVDGDGVDEIVASASGSGRPEVKVLDIKGKVKSQFSLNANILGKNLNLAIYNY